MEIYLVRHTRVAVAPGICYGQSDVACTTQFEEEVGQVRQKLGNLADYLVYSSPLKRCTCLAEKLSANFVMDNRLLELHFGDWEMQAWSSLEGPQLGQWMADFVNVPPPNGESYRDLYQRCEEFLGEVSGKHQDQKLVLVTHGGVIRAIVSYLLGLPLENSFRLAFDYGSVSLVDMGKRSHKVHFLNR